MIGPTGAVRVMVATKPVDFRKGAEGLAGLVRETMKSDPFSGAVYVFRAKRAVRLSAAELSALLEGLDWKRVHAARDAASPLDGAHQPPRYRASEHIQ